MQDVARTAIDEYVTRRTGRRRDEHLATIVHEDAHSIVTGHALIDGNERLGWSRYACSTD